MNNFIIPIVAVTVILGVVIGYIFRKAQAEGKLNNASLKAREIVEQAQKEAITKQKEAVIEAKEQIQKMKEKMHEEITKEERDRKSEWGQVEKRLHVKEDMLDKKQMNLDAKEEAIRPGTSPIDLIDGDDLVSMLKELRLGVNVKMVEEVEVDCDWFKTI